MGEPQNIVVLQDGDRTIHLVGTAHVSRQSVEEVQRIIEQVRPDTVCVELDKGRYETLTDESRWQKLDIFQVIKEKKMLFLLASLALAAYQRRIGEQLGVKPGSELLAAVDAAKAVGAEVVLVDRDIQATLKRTWSSISFWEKTKLLSALGAITFGGGDDDEITEDEVEALKDRGHFSQEFAKAIPQVKKPLIDERDQFMMSKIQEAPGKTIVAVVGAGHIEGMSTLLGKECDREALSKLPPPSKVMTVLKWIIPLAMLVAFYYGYREHSSENLKDMLFAWVLPNAIGAGLMTLVARGKPLSVLTATLASPITSLNPTIGAGMAVGLVEAWLRKPTVEDAEKLGTEVNTFGGMFRNPFSRILIVAIAANLGSMVGAWVGASWVLSYV